MKRHGLNSILGWLCFLGVLCPGAAAAESPPPRLYALTTETGMPHLEENLRYAVRNETRCMSKHDLSAAFWMLEDVSLQDCTLVKATDEADSATYLLKCDGGHGTTGDARWQFGPDVITGTLRVRLGGKNMTFYQRITAKPVIPLKWWTGALEPRLLDALLACAARGLILA